MNRSTRKNKNSLMLPSLVERFTISYPLFPIVISKRITKGWESSREWIDAIESPWSSKAWTREDSGGQGFGEDRTWDGKTWFDEESKYGVGSIPMVRLLQEIPIAKCQNPQVQIPLNPSLYFGISLPALVTLHRVEHTLPMGQPRYFVHALKVVACVISTGALPIWICKVEWDTILRRFERDEIGGIFHGPSETTSKGGESIEANEEHFASVFLSS